MCSHNFIGFVVVPVCCWIIHIVTPRTDVVASTCSYDCVASPQGPRLTPSSFAGWTKVISKTTSLKRKVHVSLVCVCCDCRFHTTPPPYLGSYVLVLKPYVPSYDFSYGCRTQHMHLFCLNFNTHVFQLLLPAVIVCCSLCMYSNLPLHMWYMSSHTYHWFYPSCGWSRDPTYRLRALTSLLPAVLSLTLTVLMSGLAAWTRTCIIS